jgi:hypothetical protein
MNFLDRTRAGRCLRERIAGLGQTSPVLQHRLSCRRLAIVALDNSTGLGRGAKSRCVRAARGSDNVSLHKAPEVA